MKLNEERGTILRITFDIVYPSGQFKTVSMSMAEYDEWKDVGVIALNEEAIKKFIVPSLDKESGEKALIEYNELHPETFLKPALFLVHNNGHISLDCNGHGSSGHKEKGNAVQRFM